MTGKPMIVPVAPLPGKEEMFFYAILGAIEATTVESACRYCEIAGMFAETAWQVEAIKKLALLLDNSFFDD